MGSAFVFVLVFTWIEKKELISVSISYAERSPKCLHSTAVIFFFLFFSLVCCLQPSNTKMNHFFVKTWRNPSNSAWLRVLIYFKLLIVIPFWTRCIRTKKKEKKKKKQTKWSDPYLLLLLFNEIYSNWICIPLNHLLSFSISIECRLTETCAAREGWGIEKWKIIALWQVKQNIYRKSKCH